MPLSDAACRKAKSTDKPQKLTDGGGMYLFVHPKGGRYWRLDYRFDGRRKTLALGVYPDTSLASAREKRAAARTLLAAGSDPGAVKQAAKRKAEVEAESAFEAVARRWHASMVPGWDEGHAARVLSKLERDIFPQFGAKLITSIEAPEVLEALRKVEARGAIDVTKRTRQYIGRIFRFAIAEGIAARDPAADVRGALKAAPKVRHRAKLEAKDVPEFLHQLEAYDGEEQTQLGLKLIFLTLVRTSELRFAEWSEFDLDGKEPTWRIPAAKMKMVRDHIVPLPHQALPILERLRKIAGNRPWVLPANTKTGVISENTLLFAIYRMGYHSRLTTHGLRGTASTILNENDDFDSDWIEAQLAHEQVNKVRGAYNAAKWLPQRRKMLQWWADYLDECLKLSSNNQ